ncbi:MAG: hypothetical protein JKY26_01690 [Pseudomonas sp.]|nr:hypothetical protein [Pseudomonas sp.]
MKNLTTEENKMHTQKVIFGKSKDVAGKVIRLFTWSNYNHVALLDETEKFVIEATAHNGVQRVSVENFKSRYAKWEIATIPSRVPTNEVLLGALAEIRLPYDWWGVFGLVLRKRLQYPSKWFCSELVAAKTHLYRQQGRITPQHIFNISAVKS